MPDCATNIDKDSTIVKCSFNTNTFPTGDPAYDSSPGGKTNTDKTTACPSYAQACGNNDSGIAALNTATAVGQIIKAKHYTDIYTKIHNIAADRNLSNDIMDVVVDSGYTVKNMIDSSPNTGFDLAISKIVNSRNFNPLANWANNLTTVAADVDTVSRGTLIKHEVFTQLEDKLKDISKACSEVNHCSCEAVCSCDTVCSCNCNLNY